MNTQIKTKAKVKQAVPFFGVKDIEASVKYYVDGLGFELRNKWVHENKLRWCWLQIDDAALMLQEFWEDGLNANLSQHRPGEGVSVYFVCEDALAFYHEVVSKGIEVAEPFVGNNMWVTALT